MKRTLSLLLALLMLLVVFAGCKTDGTTTPSSTPTPTATVKPTDNTDEPDEPTPEVGYPIVTDGSVTLEIWYALGDDVSAYIQDLANGENIAWQKAMDDTGVKIKFIHPSSTGITETFQLMIASQIYPDIINGGVTYYTGGGDKAIEDDVFIDLAPLVPTYAPNYDRWINMSETNRKWSVTDSGHMPGFSQVYDRVQPQFLGYGVRQDWLDELGMNRPETIADWHEMLVSFKDNYTGGKAPMDLQTSGIPASHFFIGAYGVAGQGLGSGYFIQKDGKVEFSAVNDGFRAYLEQMALWYKDGLIDPDYITNGGMGFFPVNARISTGESGASMMMYTWAGEYLSNVGMAPAGANFTLPIIPKLNKGDDLFVNMKTYENVTGPGAAITTACDTPEYAVRFMDYFYSEEGMITANYGVEGETFTYVDGKPVHTDLIAKNPDGMTTTNAQVRYLIHNGFMVFILDREEDVQSATALEYRENWGGIGKYNITANLTYSAEEGQERSAILQDINTRVDEYVNKAITGNIQITDETWNAFLSDLKTMKLERAVAITQTAYDRFDQR